MAHYDVLVVGAGHAGCEAAWIAARLGRRVGLCSLSLETVALMPCNPAIGGTAKGHLVREIDALGGVMGSAIDATGLQFKLLNRSRGPAVWSPRAQADKRRYSSWMRDRLRQEPNIEWVIGHVSRLRVAGGRVEGLELDDGTFLRSRCVILTTGTFLNGLVHVGSEQRPAGRYGEGPAIRLAQSVKALGLPWGRLKTGTPPRLHRRSIDFSRLQAEEGDATPVPFSFLTDRIDRPQIQCHVVHTSEAVHDLVRENIGLSPLYNGQIRGVGPRYCPSLEDKVMRFPEKDRHQLFLEPEGMDVDEIYVNGYSMSLPADVQRRIVRALPGLEEAEMVRPGYAVEYDFVQPTALSRTLECKSVEGLFLAGQINGTSGYEEAGAQGIIAGINAARASIDEERFVLGREDGYIGVLIDDLTTQGCLEPYRMFTSRAEFRLLLRADNADRRLTPLGRQIGTVDDDRWTRFSERQDRLIRHRQHLESTFIRAADGNRVPASTLLKRPEVRLSHLIEQGHVDWDAAADSLEAFSVETDIKYEGYLRRQESDLARMRRSEHRGIPEGFSYDGIPGLSTEIRQRLAQIRPETVGQAARIPGVTPAAVAILSRHLERRLSNLRGAAEA